MASKVDIISAFETGNSAALLATAVSFQVKARYSTLATDFRAYVSLYGTVTVTPLAQKRTISHH